MSPSPLDDWISRKSVNHTKLNNGTLYIQCQCYKSRQDFWHTAGYIWKRRWNSMRNMATQSIIQNIQEILLLSKVYSNSDPETYLLLQIGIVMGTADFAIHAS